MKIRITTIIIVLLTILLGIYLFRNNGILKNGWPAGKSAKPVVKNLTEIPEALPKDLLPEPAAPSLIQVTETTKYSQEIKIKYNSLNPLGSVLALYQQVLKAKGWSVEVASQNNKQASLKCKQGDKEASFLLVQTETNGTEVTLDYLNKIK